MIRRSELRRLPRTFWILWAGTLVNRAGSFVVPLLSFYLARERGWQPAQIGLAVGVWGLGQVLAGLCGGALADRVGRRPTLIFTLCAGASATLLLAVVRAPLAVGAACFGLGLLGELYRPAVAAAVADVVPAADRGLAFSLHYWAVNLASAAAVMLAGFLARLSYLGLFVGDAATTLAFAALLWAWLPETRPARAPSQAGGVVRAAPDLVFLAFCGLNLLFWLVFVQHLAGLPTDLSRRGLRESSYGGLMAINGVLIVFLQPLLSGWIARARRGWVLSFGSLLVGAGFGLTGLVQRVPLLASSVALWSVGEIFVLPVSSVVIADCAPVHARGRYQGVFQAVVCSGFFFGPLLGNALLQRAGAGALWAASAGVGALAALGFLWLGRALELRARAAVAAASSPTAEPGTAALEPAA